MAMKSKIKKATKKKNAKAAKKTNARGPVPKHYIFAMKFAKVYPLYVQKAENKNRTKEEVDQIICWLTGYTRAGLQKQLERECDLETFYSEAPAIHPNTSLIQGVVCGVRVEEMEDPLMQKVRWLDKLIDELAKGKAMEKILRQQGVD
jgi:hypothetical protein